MREHCSCLNISYLAIPVYQAHQSLQRYPARVPRKVTHDSVPSPNLYSAIVEALISASLHSIPATNVHKFPFLEFSPGTPWPAPFCRRGFGFRMFRHLRD